MVRRKGSEETFEIIGNAHVPQLLVLMSWQAPVYLMRMFLGSAIIISLVSGIRGRRCVKSTFLGPSDLARLTSSCQFTVTISHTPYGDGLRRCASSSWPSLIADLLTPTFKGNTLLRLGVSTEYPNFVCLGQLFTRQFYRKSRL